MSCIVSHSLIAAINLCSFQILSTITHEVCTLLRFIPTPVNSGFFVWILDSLVRKPYPPYTSLTNGTESWQLPRCEMSLGFPICLTTGKQCVTVYLEDFENLFLRLHKNPITGLHLVYQIKCGGCNPLHTHCC